MKRLPEFEAYINEVCGYVQCKKAHPDIAAELQNHMEDQKIAYTVMGMSEDSATSETIRQMGNAACIGAELNRTHRPRTNWVLLTGILTAVAVGLVLQYFVLANSGSEYQSELFSLTISLPIGIAVMTAAFFMDCTLLLAKYPLCLYLFFIGICAAAVATPDYFRLRAYTADFGVLLFVPLFAGILYKQKSKSMAGVFLCGLLIIPVVLLSAFGNYSKHTVCIIVLAYLAIMLTAISKSWFGKKRLRLALLSFMPLLVLAVVIWLLNCLPYGRLDNFFTFYGSQFQDWLAPPPTIRFELTRETLAGAQWIGHAIVPDNVLENIYQFQSTYMLTYIIGKFGWLAGLGVIAAMSAIVIRMSVLTCRQKNQLTFWVLLAVTLMIGLQSGLCILLNLTGWIAIPANTVPLMLGSGASLIANLCLVGIFLSVSRYQGIMSENAMHQIIEE
ncbi:MAG: permease prefix domain 1-containing protein [Christensenella sp.]|nr:permease prefix domain 1-containing protein [Christensenella sp.]